MNQYDLSQKSAAITGGAQGIGRAIAERFIASGATVALWDQDGDHAERTAAELGPAAIAVAADVTDLASIDAARDKTIEKHGTIDILVNNAGITGPNTTTWDYPPDAWAQVFKVNVHGVFHCCRSVVPIMRQQNCGRVINIASVAGKEGNPNAPAYSASKAAVIALTKSLGKELADTPITVNCITPAAAKTAIFDQMTEDHIAYMLSKIPLGRFVEVNEIASLAAWLASEECSFSTGAVFDISGGRATY